MSSTETETTQIWGAENKVRPLHGPLFPHQRDDGRITSQPPPSGPPPAAGTGTCGLLPSSEGLPPLDSFYNDTTVFYCNNKTWASLAELSSTLKTWASLQTSSTLKNFINSEGKTVNIILQGVSFSGLHSAP
ncbi:hypothetical protein WMY93_034196 [Mugilogobius chulae]|uniref:Uncharacterized protein n=1 Tax=Mugilogobius chulae TaxID=88201 RepID=A0AAW0MPB3_9GOBI